MRLNIRFIATAWKSARMTVSQRVYREICFRPARSSLQLLQLGNSHREELHDDRGVDVGRDRHRQDRVFAQRASGEGVQQAHQAAGAGRARPSGAVDPWKRYMQRDQVILANI